MTVKRRSKPGGETGEVLYGFNPVFEAMAAGRRTIREILVSSEKKGQRLGGVLDQAESKGIRVTHVPRTRLDEIAATGNHQGVAARVSPFRYAGLDQLMTENPFLLLVDGVEDPRNLGALVRTADCVGVSGIVIPKDRSASPTPLVSKTSAGALEHANIARVTNMAATIKELKKSGVWIAGLDAAGESALFECDFSGPVGIIVGGEGKGVRPLVRKQCDFLISIPQLGHVNSLNASVAGSVVMYEVLRQRRQMV